jgi:hypothetical protein
MILPATLIAPITAALAGFSFEGVQRYTHASDPHAHTVAHTPHYAGRHSAYRARARAPASVSASGRATVSANVSATVRLASDSELLIK